MAPLLHNITMWRDKNERASSVQHQNALSLSLCSLLSHSARSKKASFPASAPFPPSPEKRTTFKVLVSLLRQDNNIQISGCSFTQRRSLGDPLDYQKSVGDVVRQTTGLMFNMTHQQFWVFFSPRIFFWGRNRDMLQDGVPPQVPRKTESKKRLDPRVGSQHQRMSACCSGKKRRRCGSFVTLVTSVEGLRHVAVLLLRPLLIGDRLAGSVPQTEEGTDCLHVKICKPLKCHDTIPASRNKVCPISSSSNQTFLNPLLHTLKFAFSINPIDKKVVLFCKELKPQIWCQQWIGHFVVPLVVIWYIVHNLDQPLSNLPTTTMFFCRGHSHKMSTIAKKAYLQLTGGQLATYKQQNVPFHSLVPVTFHFLQTVQV